MTEQEQEEKRLPDATLDALTSVVADAYSQDPAVQAVVNVLRFHESTPTIRNEISTRITTVVHQLQANALNSSFEGDKSHTGRGVRHDDIAAAYSSISGRTLGGEIRLGLSTSSLSLGIGALFTLYATTPNARPPGGLFAAYCLTTLGLFLFAQWVFYILKHRP